MNAWLKYLDHGIRSVPEWMADHPLRVDLIIFGVVLLAVVMLVGSQKRRMKRAHRLYRGIMMRRENLKLFQRMKIEDAIGSACLDMNLAGEMTDEQEKEWYRLFHVKMGMDGMVPRKSNYHIKKAIKARLYKLQHEADLAAIAIKSGIKRLRWWGDPPSVAVDSSYQPSDDPVPLTSKQSRFAKKVA